MLALDYSRQGLFVNSSGWDHFQDLLGYFSDHQTTSKNLLDHFSGLPFPVQDLRIHFQGPSNPF